ncbi:MAG: PRC-barrel domain-containing protein [Solirubrobacterales bacterium]
MPESPPPGAEMPTLAEVVRWTGFDVDEVDGTRVGRVHSVFTDAASGEPTWLIVALGRRGAKRVAIPLRDCAGAANRVWTVHGREALRTAPAVDPARPLLREHELTICRYFGISEKVGRAAEIVDRPVDSVTSQPA